MEHSFDTNARATQPQINSAVYQLINRCLDTMGNKDDALPRTANRLKAWCRASLFTECDHGVIRSSDVNSVRVKYADSPSPRVIRHFLDDTVNTLADTLVSDGIAKRTANSMVKRLQKAIAVARKIDFDSPAPTVKVKTKTPRKSKAAPAVKAQPETGITADMWEGMTETAKSEIAALVAAGAIKIAS